MRKPPRSLPSPLFPTRMSWPLSRRPARRSPRVRPTASRWLFEAVPRAETSGRGAGPGCSSRRNVFTPCVDLQTTQEPRHSTENSAGFSKTRICVGPSSYRGCAGMTMRYFLLRLLPLFFKLTSIRRTLLSYTSLLSFSLVFSFSSSFLFKPYLQRSL